MKKQEIRKDPIREYLIKSVQYIQEHKSTVVKVFVCIGLVIGALSYTNYSKSLKIENSTHIAGKAQNDLINGNIDEAFVKFERVLEDYPNTDGALQSLICLLNNDIVNNDEEAMEKHLSEFNGKVTDNVISAALFKLKGDIALNQGDEDGALNFYKKAKSESEMIKYQNKYSLDIISVLINQSNYDDAHEELEKMLNDDGIGYNEKNIIEEYLAFVTHKLGI